MDNIYRESDVNRLSSYAHELSTYLTVEMRPSFPKDLSDKGDRSPVAGGEFVRHNQVCHCSSAGGQRCERGSPVATGTTK